MLCLKLGKLGVTALSSQSDSLTLSPGKTHFHLKVSFHSKPCWYMGRSGDCGWHASHGYAYFVRNVAIVETAGTSRALGLPLRTLQLGVGMKPCSSENMPAAVRILEGVFAWCKQGVDVARLWVGYFGGVIWGSALTRLHWTSYGSTLQLSIQIEFAWKFIFEEFYHIWSKL